MALGEDVDVGVDLAVEEDEGEGRDVAVERLELGVEDLVVFTPV